MELVGVRESYTAETSLKQGPQWRAAHAANLGILSPDTNRSSNSTQDEASQYHPTCGGPHLVKLITCDNYYGDKYQPKYSDYKPRYKERLMEKL